MLLLFHTVLGPFKQRKQSKEEHSILYMLYMHSSATQQCQQTAASQGNQNHQDMIIEKTENTCCAFLSFHIEIMS